MTPSWLTPQALDDVSIVGVVLFTALLMGVAVGRRWLIPGGQHREIVAMHAVAKAELLARVDAQAATIDTLIDTNRAQARALARCADAGELSGRLLASVRDIAEAGVQ